MIKPRFFDQLRTKEQLGYVVLTLPIEFAESSIGGIVL